MFHIQTLDVYRCAVAFLPTGYGLASPRRAWRWRVVGIDDRRITDGHTLLVRIVSMLTERIG